MIHYHGSPMTPASAAASFYSTRHACVSYAHPGQMSLVAETCQSFIIDNGAYTTWKSGKEFDFHGYCDFVREWCRHPGFDWCLIPDVIDGTELENTKLIARFQQEGLLDFGVPVWHMHESLELLQYYSRAYKRIALGSSGEYAVVRSKAWVRRMNEAMETICDGGRPRCKVHGLRMLDPKVFTRFPLASADSTTVTRNIIYDNRWTGSYQPASEYVRAVVLADRIERQQSASFYWPEYLELEETQLSLELVT